MRALSVEQLATTLGVTKGSFYWHFKSRQELLSAAVNFWADAATHQVISELSALDDPRARLAGLLTAAFRDLDELRVEAALLGAASSGHPAIAPVVEQVTQDRISYLVDLYTQIGVEQPETWALCAYAAYLGSVQLAAMQPSPLATQPRESLVSLLQARLIPPTL